MKYKNKYLIAKIRGTDINQAVINVKGMRKKNIESRWDELDNEFPSPKYITCLSSTNEELRELVNKI